VSSYAIRYLESGAKVISFGVDYELVLSNFDVDRDVIHREPLDFMAIIDDVPHWVVRHAVDGRSAWQAISSQDFKCRYVPYTRTVAASWQIRLANAPGAQPNEPLIQR
jgi:hypothetical protein